MREEGVIEAGRKKANIGAPQLTSSYFYRKPFNPGTPAHVVKASEEAEREQLLRLIVKKRTVAGEPVDQVSLHGEVDELQKSLRCGAVISIF